MKNNIITLLFLTGATFLLTHCTKKGIAITEPRFGTVNINTYTTDTFRFSVLLNDQLLTDSLRSPIGTFSKTISFFDTVAQIKVIDSRTQQVIDDSLINLSIGNTTFTIVQFLSGVRPFILPVPSVPPPQSGRYKIRFQYTKPSNAVVPYFDSVKCIIRIQNAASPSLYNKLDSTILSRGEFTRFYDTVSTLRYRIILLNPLTNVQISSPITPILLDTPPGGFNTVIARGTGTIGTTQGPYFFELLKVF